MTATDFLGPSLGGVRFFLLMVGFFLNERDYSVADWLVLLIIFTATLKQICHALLLRCLVGLYHVKHQNYSLSKKYGFEGSANADIADKERRGCLTYADSL